MKTSSLEGALLDYWVARSIPLDVADRLHVSGGYLYVRADNGGLAPFAFMPSRGKWSDAGPIISAMRISLVAVVDRCVDPPKVVSWVACMPERVPSVVQCGPDQLTAAMRCFVASRIGDEVPDGLFEESTDEVDLGIDPIVVEPDYLGAFNAYEGARRREAGAVPK